MTLIMLELFLIKKNTNNKTNTVRGFLPSSAKPGCKSVQASRISSWTIFVNLQLDEIVVVLSPDIATFSLVSLIIRRETDCWRRREHVRCPDFWTVLTWLLRWLLDRRYFNLCGFFYVVLVFFSTNPFSSDLSTLPRLPHPTSVKRIPEG